MKGDSMQVKELVGALVRKSGKSANALSADLGKSREYVRNIAVRAAAPRLDTIADIADVAGCDLVIVDRATGETVGVVDPPRRSASEH